jgi:translation elongation factor EF-1alpha
LFTISGSSGESVDPDSDEYVELIAKVDATLKSSSSMDVDSVVVDSDDSMELIAKEHDIQHSTRTHMSALKRIKANMDRRKREEEPFIEKGRIALAKAKSEAAASKIECEKMEEMGRFFTAFADAPIMQFKNDRQKPMFEKALNASDSD